MIDINIIGLFLLLIIFLIYFNIFKCIAHYKFKSKKVTTFKKLESLKK